MAKIFLDYIWPKTFCGFSDPQPDPIYSPSPPRRTSSEPAAGDLQPSSELPAQLAFFRRRESETTKNDPSEIRPLDYIQLFQLTLSDQSLKRLPPHPFYRLNSDFFHPHRISSLDGRGVADFDVLNHKKIHRILRFCLIALYFDPTTLIEIAVYLTVPNLNLLRHFSHRTRPRGVCARLREPRLDSALKIRSGAIWGFVGCQLTQTDTHRKG